MAILASLGGRVPFESLVAHGEVPGVTILNALGERPGIGVTASGEDVWPGSAASIPVPSSAGVTIVAISGDTEDTSDGDGVQQICVEYLDTDCAAQSVTVTMNGDSEVAVASGVTFVNDVYAVRVGVTEVAEGDIDIYLSGDATTIYNMIEAGGNKSLVPNRMVPLGKSLVIMGWSCTEGTGDAASFRIRSSSKPDGTLNVDADGNHVFLFKAPAYLGGSTLSHSPLGYLIPAKAIVKVSVWDRSAGQAPDGSVHWWGYLIDD